MIKLENTEVLGWEHAIRGMRNPMNSWEKSDSGCEHCFDSERDCDMCGYHIGRNDHDLMMRLAKGGPVHAKYRRMITVYVDITAPLYWWKEFDTYKVGTVANSCSTMHKIAAKEFTLEDFSCEHLLEKEDDMLWSAKNILDEVIMGLNHYRKKYLETKSKPMKNEQARKELIKKYWWQMIQLLPTSYNQKRTVMLNYEVLTGIYPSRKNHKLDEWHTFCDWIEDLPYSEIIVGERSDDTGMTDEEKDKLFEEINKILKTEYPKLDSDTLQVIHEKAEEILEEGKNIDWKKANPKLYPEDQRFEILDAISLGKKAGVIHEIPSFDIDKFSQEAEAVTLVPGMTVKDEWPSNPEEISEALEQWDRIIERIKNGEIPTTTEIPIYMLLHCVPEENWPTACNLCNEHGCGDSDEETCKKCQFYQYSKWAKEENVGPNDGLNKHFGGYEE